MSAALGQYSEGTTGGRGRRGGQSARVRGTARLPPDAPPDARPHCARRCDSVVSGASSRVGPTRLRAALAPVLLRGERTSCVSRRGFPDASRAPTVLARLVAGRASVFCACASRGTHSVDAPSSRGGGDVGDGDVKGARRRAYQSAVLGRVR